MDFLPKVGPAARRIPWFQARVVLPVLLSAIYFVDVGCDQYVSESRFVVKALNQQVVQVLSFASLNQTAGLSAGQERSNQLIYYVRSGSALEVLVRERAISDIFGRSGDDVLSRFPRSWEPRSFEDLFDYYRDKVQISCDVGSGMVVLRTIAFDRKEAPAINETLLRLREQLINELNGNVRISATEEATGLAEIANRLITVQTAFAAQLSTLHYVTPDQPATPALREQVALLTREIDRQTARVVGGRDAISGKLPSYVALTLEQELVSELLVLAQTTLDGALTEALKQQFYLEWVVNPNVPGHSEYLKVLPIVPTVLGFTLYDYFIFCMFVLGF